MRKGITGMFILLLPLLATGQEQDLPFLSNLPEVQHSFAPPSPEDTAHIFGLIRTANRIKMTETDSARYILNRALQQSRGLRFPDGIASALVELGACDLLQGHYEQSIRLFRQAYSYADKSFFIKDDLIPLIYNNLAVAYNYLGRDEIALYYHYKSLQLLGRNISNIQDYRKRIPLAYLNIGITLYRNGQHDQAFYYFKQAEKIALTSGEHEFLGDIYINMAKRYRMKKDWPNHDLYAQKALQWWDTLHQSNSRQTSRQITTILSSLGESYIAQGEHRTAIRYFRQAENSIQSNNPYDSLLVYKGLGTAYYLLKDYPKARSYLLLALHHVDRLYITSALTGELHQTLASLYHETGENGRAYTHEKIYSQLNDSLMNAERNKTINQLEINFRTSEKDVSIAQQSLMLQQKESELKDKNTWIIGISAAGLLLTTAILSIYRINRHREQINKLKAIVEGEEQERTRIGRDLHDGIMVQFSAVKMNLSTLINRYSHLPGIEDFKYPLDQLDDATRELRRTAHNLMPAALLEEGLSEAVYFFCKGLQQSTQMNIHFQLYGKVPRLTADFELSVYRIIQELVHNIIKHAEASEALVQLSGQNNLLMVSVEDNGKGMSEHLLSGQQGMGLKTVHTRIAALKGHLDLQSSEGKGTIVYAEFDISHFIREKPIETWA